MILTATRDPGTHPRRGWFPFKGAHAVRSLRFRLRTLMIVIAVLALVSAATVFVLRTYREINAALNAFYGPDGS
jgi:heme/copper-type cytochrome/quinol oxidase subunit 2